MNRPNPRPMHRLPELEPGSVLIAMRQAGPAKVSYLVGFMAAAIAPFRP